VKKVVISVGGSLLVPDGIDEKALLSLKVFVEKNDNTRFFIVVGGGKVCREYQFAAQKIGCASAIDQDWIGVAATRLNAHLVRSVISETDDDIITNPTTKITTKKRVLVAAGWKPGHSTDYDTVLLAENVGASTIINMTNVDYLYDKDPRQKGAKRIKHATWKELQQIVGTTWKPGLNMPFDPVATTKAAQLKLKLYLIGPDMTNLQKILENKPFSGTTIE
jgi:uridylate kinase